MKQYSCFKNFFKNFSLCHLTKCIVCAGVVPEYQCAVKRKEKKAQKDKDKPVSSSNGSPEMRLDQDTIRVSVTRYAITYLC